MTRIPLALAVLKVARTFAFMGTTRFIAPSDSAGVALIPGLDVVEVTIGPAVMWINREDFEHFVPMEVATIDDDVPAQPIAGAGSRARGPKPRR